MAPVVSKPTSTLKTRVPVIRPVEQTVGQPDGALVWSASGIVEIALLLPGPWFEELLDDAETQGVSIARLLRGLVLDQAKVGRGFAADG
jgi:hypothetical protein